MLPYVMGEIKDRCRDGRRKKMQSAEPNVHPLSGVRGRKLTLAPESGGVSGPAFIKPVSQGKFPSSVSFQVLCLLRR